MLERHDSVTVLPSYLVDFSRLEREEIPDRENLERIYERDADRTWVEKEDPEKEKRSVVRRKVMVDNMKMCAYTVGQYHQGLGFIGAFASLFLGQIDTVRLCLALHSSTDFCNGYFRNSAEKFLSDARVFFDILRSRDPILAKHLDDNGVGYGCIQGWLVKPFVGLCIHLLTFEALLGNDDDDFPGYWELVFTNNIQFAYKFVLSFCSELNFRKELLAAKNTSELMTILRVEDEGKVWIFPKVA